MGGALASCGLQGPDHRWPPSLSYDVDLSVKGANPTCLVALRIIKAQRKSAYLVHGLACSMEPGSQP